MFTQKIQMQISFIILAATVQSSEASTAQQGLDSVGMMPEITVTAPRYEYQDDAWLGMIEGIVVEARRPSSSRDECETRDESQDLVSGNVVSKDIESSSMNLMEPMYLFLLLVIATLSFVYLVIRDFLQTKEAKHARTKH